MRKGLNESIEVMECDLSDVRVGVEVAEPGSDCRGPDWFPAESSAQTKTEIGKSNRR